MWISYCLSIFIPLKVWGELYLVPRVVSEPRFQSSPQRTTTAEVIVFEGEFDLIAMKFRIFLFIATSILFSILC